MSHGLIVLLQELALKLEGPAARFNYDATRTDVTAFVEFRHDGPWICGYKLNKPHKI